nr:hypothetical protein [Tanacetum cinerariifolium]
MSSITAQQTKLDLELVPKVKRLKIEKCNGRLYTGMKQREPTFQVVLDSLALTPCYFAFLIIADVPKVYMHQFWDTIYKYENSYRFKMDKKKKFDLNLEIFRDIFQICHRAHGQNTNELPTDEDIVNFATIINQSLSRKTTGLDKLRLSRAQILWGMCYKKNVDYVGLLWEDFTYQIDNRDKTISKSNKIGIHTSRDEYLINTLRFVSTKEESQIYGARLPKSMTSHKMRETKAYKTYLGYATGVTPPKKAQKFKKLDSSKLSIVPASHDELIRKSKRVKRHVKKSSNAPTAGAVIRETPMKSLFKKKEKMTSLRDFHKSHPSGSGTVTNIASSAAKIKPSVINEETSVKPGVLDVTKNESTKRSDQERDSSDDNTQSDSKKGLDSEHETDENESGSESVQEENEEEVEDDEEKEEDKSIKTMSNDTDDEDKTKIKDKAEGDEDEGMDYTTNQFDDDVDLRMNEPVTTDEGFIQKEATNPPSTLPNFASIFHFENRVTTLEKEVTELKKGDPLNTQVTSLVDEHPDSRLGATIDEFMSYLSASITARIIKQVKSQLSYNLPKEAPPVIKSIVTESLEHVVLAKESSQLKSTYEAAATLIEFKLKKILMDKIDEKFEVAYSDMPQDQENPGNDDEEPKGKFTSKCDWFTKPKLPQEPTDPFWNDRKTPQQGHTQSWLTNLSGDDVSDFTIDLRMFTRSMVFQKRVEDLQLGLESYQKKINVTKSETTRLGLRKKDPYTSYQDPQGFIYADTLGRNRLMRSDKLYKFSDGTLTRL